jgi:adenylate cyclase
LIVAEIELAHENAEFVKPDWIGREVTDDARYYNASLANYPFSRWSAGRETTPPRSEQQKGMIDK